MNNPIRRLAVLVALMFIALLVSSSIIQFAQANDLRAKPDNRRTLLATYGSNRGQILVAGSPIARSEPSNDDLNYQRVYPKGQLYSHITGYYSFMFGNGGGLEGAADELLSGQSDALFYRRIGDLLVGKKSAGVNLELTINEKAQAAANRGLGDQRGAVVALEPRTGAILALVSHPQYDPNVLATHTTSKVSSAWKELNSATGRPLVNRTIAGDLYPPGSTMKVITAAAALSSGRANQDTELTGTSALKLPGTSATLRNSGGGDCRGGRVTLTEALEMSCNTAFGQLGMDVGGQALKDQAAKFGFTQKMSIPMNVTPSSVGDMPAKPQEAFSAIGQQDVRVTPLQMAMVAAAVANNGAVMRPYLIQRTRGDGLEVLEQTAPGELSRAVSPEVAHTLTGMMERVVETGTGTRAQINGVKVAGKSGTAEHGMDGGVKRPPHAWFISFAPADDPKVAVAVVIEDGGRAGSEAAGGQISAPIAREVMKAVIAQ